VAVGAAIVGLESPRGVRSGRRPQWIRARKQERTLGAALSWLGETVEQAPNGLIGVLCFSASDAREAYSLLTPTFGPLVWLADESSFSFEEGIVVCEAYAAKGLEFFGVMVWQPVSSSLPRGDVGRHLLYIASTRAQEQLAFVSWGGAGSPLSAVSERLLDVVDLDLDDDEEEEERPPRADD
jgi:DNA helicase IV